MCRGFPFRAALCVGLPPSVLFWEPGAWSKPLIWVNQVGQLPDLLHSGLLFARRDPGKSWDFHRRIREPARERADVPEQHGFLLLWAWVLLKAFYRVF